MIALLHTDCRIDTAAHPQEAFGILGQFLFAAVGHA